MEYAVLIIASLLVAALVSLLIGTVRSKWTVKSSGSGKTGAPRQPCPACGRPLVRGEKVRSIVFEGGTEHLVHIFGCPACYPANSTWRRICPVCGKSIPPDGFLVGRMWKGRPRQAAHASPAISSAPAPPAGDRMSRTSGHPAARLMTTRQHLHILGCTECRRTGARTGGGSPKR